MRGDHSDLEVVPNDANGLHVVTKECQDEGKIATKDVQDEGKIVIHDAQEPYGGHRHDTEKEPYTVEEQPRSTRRFCGGRLSRRGLYWLVAVALLVVIAAAVGGGVGGTLGSQRNKSVSTTTSTSSEESGASGPDSTSESRSSVPPTSTSSTITTSTIHPNGPKSTIYLDCPSSNGSIYTIQQGNSEPINFRKVCGRQFDWSGAGLNVVNIHLPSLNDCINACSNYNLPVPGNGVLCNSVCYRNGSPGDDWPYNCFGGQVNATSKTSDGYEAGFQSSESMRCDGAVWINEPA